MEYVIVYIWKLISKKRKRLNICVPGGVRISASTVLRNGRDGAKESPLATPDPRLEFDKIHGVGYDTLNDEIYSGG
jgi:hypothetical protein